MTFLQASKLESSAPSPRLPYTNGRLLLIATLLLLGLAIIVASVRLLLVPPVQLLTDPFLQLPTANSVRVVWFTEFPGSRHRVEYGENLQQVAVANTTKLSRVREDQQSNVGSQRVKKGVVEGQIYTQPTYRNIWRHEAEVTGLQTNQRVPYRVRSEQNGRSVTSDQFTLAPLPAAGTPLKILLTSDHQLKPMTAANLQKVSETVGQVDAVFMAGDLVDFPDQASEWFDDNGGGAFFPALQGRAAYDLERNGITTRYTGGAIIQSAPLFPAVGNHEVMGRFSMEKTLREQFNDPFPRAAAEQLYNQVATQVNPNADPAVREAWLKDNTFNTDTYEEIFTLPTDSPGGKRYYAISFGDVRLISLFATNIWRVPSLEPDARGRYREREADFNAVERWGYGQHIFEPITPGSPQYNWLQTELARPEFQQAKYKIVMFHHPPHCLGDNVVPAYTDPVQIIDRTPEGQITAVRYEYPLESDHLIRDLMPLLDAAGVQLVFYGHSHIWNRFVSPSGMHFLESSNVGNTYGAFVGDKQRTIPVGYAERYVATGNPNGLEPVMPTLQPLLNDAQQPQPYIASNDITAFSILDTGTGTVSSYRFDTRQPDSAVIKFDEFVLGRP
ncbi:MAG: metallophosphoesterase family protein [Synechococcales cyanobacterium M58_A2018_015]|nr:metallophosphoesterase family protein [Synechococcales cyanobacterium M58_A2018_015]